jgi:hypothetical protein
MAKPSMQKMGWWFLGVALVALGAGCGGGADRPAATEADGIAACEGLSDPIDQIECRVDVATDAGHPRPCLEAEQDGVRYQCIAILAGRLKKASLCDDIPSTTEDTRMLRDGCLGDVAEVVGESDLCERVLTRGIRDSCYLKLFRVTGDATLCDRIEDPGLASLCTGNPVTVE